MTTLSIMRTFGLIGYPLSHSFSKKFFSEKFETEQIADCKYELYPIVHADEIKDLIAHSQNAVQVYKENIQKLSQVTTDSIILLDSFDGQLVFRNQTELVKE